ncbi:MAG: flagellar biosynthesis protein FlgB [Pirellulaceae bacterium]|nr:MAG: flagellar biosynthesis protein FlgB [Pirellulaceae bacterium]GIW95071.1 MAG: flagellar biosynthesis protein FlgB [Pirellulaceae bacterium]
MTSSWIASTPIPLLEQWLSFTEARHQLLAGNIANVDTPGYQARDMPVSAFQEKVREALATPMRSEYPSPGHRSAPSRLQRIRELSESYPSLLRHDGAEVSLEQQIAELTKNQIMHSLVVSLLNSQFRLLQAAVTERV